MSFSLVYIYNFFLTLLLLWICKIKQFKRIYLYIITLYYLLIFGQRWFGGIDFHGYLEYYIIGKGRSIGYGFLQELYRNHNLYFGFFIFSLYFFTTLGSLYIFRKFVYSNFGLFLFFLSEYHIMSLNPIRTYLAIVIFGIGIYYLEIKRKKIRGLISIILSVLFHYLSIGAIITYLFFKLLKRLKVYKILDLILLILPLINLRPLLKIVTNFVFPMYAHYFGSYFDKNLSMMNYIRYYIILFLFLYLKHYFISKNRKNMLIIVGMYMFLILMGMATYFAELHRIAYFYKIFEPIFFIILIEMKNVRKKIKILVVVVLITNYVGIIYKDMGVIKYMEIRKMHLYTNKSNQEYLNEIQNYLKKFE